MPISKDTSIISFRCFNKWCLTRQFVSYYLLLPDNAKEYCSLERYKKFKTMISAARKMGRSFIYFILINNQPFFLYFSNNKNNDR